MFGEYASVRDRAAAPDLKEKTKTKTRESREAAPTLGLRLWTVVQALLAERRRANSVAPTALIAELLPAGAPLAGYPHGTAVGAALTRALHRRVDGRRSAMGGSAQLGEEGAALIALRLPPAGMMLGRCSAMPLHMIRRWRPL